MEVGGTRADLALSKPPAGKKSAAAEINLLGHSE
jgi:hypothetical protein